MFRPLDPSKFGQYINSCTDNLTEYLARSPKPQKEQIIKYVSTNVNTALQSVQIELAVAWLDATERVGKSNFLYEIGRLIEPRRREIEERFHALLKSARISLEKQDDVLSITSDDDFSEDSSISLSGESVLNNTDSTE